MGLFKKQQEHLKVSFIKTSKFEKEKLNFFKRPLYFTASLYIVGAICECVWFHILWQNFDQVKRWMTMPVVGWVMAIIFIGMIIAVPFMLIAGIRLLHSINKATMIHQDYRDVKRRKLVNMLLIVGILADLFFTSFLLSSNNPDKSFIVLACAFFGGRILQANIEALSYYFSYNKKSK